MNLIKKLLFILSLITGQQLVKTGAQTEDCNVMDVCLVVDRSRSICDNDPDFVFQRDETCNNWQYLVSFIHDLVNSFNIGPNNVRVALVTFSTSSEVGWGLNNYTDKARLLAAIDGLAYIKGGMGDTASGLNLVNTLIFNAGNDRTNVAKMAIIFTDGKPSVPSTVPAAVQAVHASNIKTMCVGVTNSIDALTLKNLSSPPQQLGMTYFMAADFSTINNMSNSLQQQVCAVASTTTSGPGGYSTTASTASSASPAVPDCGGTYSDQSGTISSPNYPSDYDNNLNCTYDIQTSPAKSVNITFISFHTEPCCDYLQVICAGDSTKAIPAFFGPNLPPFLSLSSCDSVQLMFYTDYSVVGHGFSLRYDIGNGLQGGLTMKPMNSYVHSSPVTQLGCSSKANQPNVYPWWSFSKDGYLFTAITTYNCNLLSPRYNTNSYITSYDYSTGTCNLTISTLFSLTNVIGFYMCTDATLDYAVAMVDAIVPSFTVSSMGKEVVQGEQLSMTCNVGLLHKTSSHFQLTPSVYIYSGDNYQRPINVSNTAASINVTASTEILPPYVCKINFTLSVNELIDIPSNYATNIPENFVKICMDPPVLYWPIHNYMVIFGDDVGTVVTNGILTCFVQANPPVTYQWTHEETGLQWIGSTVAVTYNGTYTCTATNAIRGQTYVASKSINVTITVNDSQKNESDNKSLIAAVVLGIVVLLLLVVAIVEFVLLWRKKNSATMDVNYDFIDAVIRTDAEPAKPRVYELAERKRLDVDQGGAIGTSGRKDVPPPIPPMYDRIKDQTYDTEIHTEDKSQPYDTEIRTEDKSQPKLQTYDTEIHTEDRSQSYLQTYDDEIPVHTEDKSEPYLSLYE